MTEANKFLDKLKDGYNEVKIHEFISMPKIRMQGIMQDYADQQLKLCEVMHRMELLINFLEDVLQCQNEGETIVDIGKYVDWYLGNL